MTEHDSPYRDVGTVDAALLTTCDPPDPTLLVVDLLPHWFRLEREASADDTANRLFLAELKAELQRRKGKLAVFSSAALLRQENSHWIWSHITRHFVGARGPAVQHAKLWLLHRVSEDHGEHLDLFVSSTNLTRSAFRAQLQSGFCYRAGLQSRASRVALASWSALIPFLEQLGEHAGPAGGDAIRPWLQIGRGVGARKM